MMITLLAQSPDPLSGGAGWVGAGLLGSVLAWLLLKGLPDKDRQINAMIKASADERLETTQRYDSERNQEREARHERANQFQTMLNEMAISYAKTMKDYQLQHKVDAAEDRAAFLQRNDRLLEAIKGQTVELKLALIEQTRNMCHWRDHQQEKKA